jgi:hypothetical protein
MNISAVALQEVAAEANDCLSLGARYTLHMGPCGQGPKGGAMRGCAWVVDNQWATQVSVGMGSAQSTQARFPSRLVREELNLFRSTLHLAWRSQQRRLGLARSLRERQTFGFATALSRLVLIGCMVLLFFLATIVATALSRRAFPFGWLPGVIGLSLGGIGQPRWRQDTPN